MLKQIIEDYLLRLGFTNIVWKYGREGYYVLAKDSQSSVFCYNINDIVEEILRKELEKIEL